MLNDNFCTVSFYLCVHFKSVSRDSDSKVRPLMQQKLQVKDYSNR